MGEWTSFSCTSCGYESGSIRWGAGMLDPRIRFLPAECSHCREYVEIDLTGADLVVDTFCCPQCESEVFFVDKKDSYRCPQCGAENVRLSQGQGYW
ncbi:MAG: hypothetical protein Kow00129_01730 [Thermoleophilia bacterium]